MCPWNQIQGSNFLQLCTWSIICWANACGTPTAYPTQHSGSRKRSIKHKTLARCDREKEREGIVFWCQGSGKPLSHSYCNPAKNNLLKGERPGQEKVERGEGVCEERHRIRSNSFCSHCMYDLTSQVTDVMQQDRCCLCKGFGDGAMLPKLVINHWA